MIDPTPMTKAVSWSKLRHMAKSPRHFQHALKEGYVDTAQMRIGKALHTAFLEPDEFQDRHPVGPTKGRNSKQWREWQQSVIDGVEPLTASEQQQVLNMDFSLRCNPRVMEQFEGAYIEQSLEWVDDETGVLLRGRCDSVNGHLVELKTTASANFELDAFERHAYKMLYPAQVALYQAGLEAAGYATDKAPSVVVVEQSAPFDCYVADVPDWLEIGKVMYRKLLRQYVACCASNEWHGVDGGKVHRLSVPQWAFSRWLDDVPGPRFKPGGY